MTRDQLLTTWRESVSIMHIAHHKAAARCSNWHLWLGVIATVLAAGVGASVFAKLTKYAENLGPIFLLAVGSVSLVSAAMTAVVTFLKLDERANRHTRAAANFQGVRREIEEEIVRLAEGKSADNNYKMI